MYIPSKKSNSVRVKKKIDLIVCREEIQLKKPVGFVDPNLLRTGIGNEENRYSRQWFKNI